MSDTLETKPIEKVGTVTIRFAGDSGDGMQLTGTRFTSATAALGNDLATLPDFPAEIRAPAGSLFGVSGFQLHFADHDILTPGDDPDVLVAMNPAALKANVGDLRPGATIIVNEDAFTSQNLKKARYDQDPRGDGSLDSFRVIEVPITTLTVAALEEYEDLNKKQKQRAKNMFALGLMSWMYSRPTGPTKQWLREKFASQPTLAEANVTTFDAGWNFGETTELFDHRYEVAPAELPKGRYRQITGNTALSYGLVAASERAGLRLFLGGYPITPASDVLHELSRHKQFGVQTFQAEDEIAGVGASLGASFAGQLAATVTSGPGIALKAETVGLGVAVELPLVVINVQRGGPSTGLPTKTEQADLLQALFGRNGEAPVPVIAPATPGDCFHMAIEAARIALKYRTPVIMLSDGYLANGAEPWRVPQVDELPDLNQSVAFATEPNASDGEFHPFVRDEQTLGRPWAIPGTPGLEHRIGGLEKADQTGDISYDPDNHHRMTELRQAKVDRLAFDVPPVEVDVADEDRARLLILGWGSTYGPVAAAVRAARHKGYAVDQAHLRHLNPFPANLGDVLEQYERVLVPEMNLGQLRMLLRARYLVDVRGYNRVRGLPFTTHELVDQIATQLADLDATA